MAVFIAGLILIGVLVAGGGMAEKASTGDTESPATAGTIETSDGGAYLSCGHVGPHQRDLTVPYVSRPAAAPMPSEGRVVCGDE